MKKLSELSLADLYAMYEMLKYVVCPADGLRDKYNAIQDEMRRRVRQIDFDN